MTVEQIDEQLRALARHEHLRIMVATLIYSGLRREVLLWLKQSDIDLDPGSRSGLIRVRAKTVGARTWQPKTKSNRVVPISSDLYGYLAHHHPTSAVDG